MVNGRHRESTIDHVYSSNPKSILNVSSKLPYFGIHLLKPFDLLCEKPEPVITIKRSWRSYTKLRLFEQLSKIDWNICEDSVQSFRNVLENKLIEAVDTVAPLAKFVNSC
jgi:hypothetical protein